MSAQTKLIHAELSYRINGILFQVHNQLGRYCNEKQYADAIEGNLKLSGISFEREKTLDPSFSNERRGRNKVDFLIENEIVLEVKAKRLILKDDYYQIRRYLQALKKKLGLIVNFREKYIRPRRVLNSNVKE
jgi:GxxExxY protein